MQILFLSPLLAAIFGLFVPSAQTRLRGLLLSKPGAVWAVPFLLAAYFTAASAAAGTFSLELTAVVLAYTLLPTRRRRRARSTYSRLPASGSRSNSPARSPT
jgi:hypothetical protein